MRKQKDTMPHRPPRIGRVFSLNQETEMKIAKLSAWRDCTRSELIRRLVEAEYEREDGKHRSNRA